MIPLTTTAYIQGQARHAMARRVMARHADRRYLVVVDYVGPT